MMNSLRPYPANKPTGLQWLAEVPSHWQTLPGRACFKQKAIPNVGLKQRTVLSLSYGRIIVKPEEKLHGLVPASFETYQIVEPGDIICRPTDLQNDWNSLRFGISHEKGIITSAYLCIQTTDHITRKYGYLLFHTYDLKKVFYGLGSGLRQNLDWRDFKYLPCLVPSLDEQTAIVKFLDYADSCIRRYIRAKQKLVKLLEEQKQSIIQQAVTRGLNPDAPMKDSGVEWLGQVPKHWEVRPLKFWASINARTLVEKTSPDFEFRYIDIGTVSKGRLANEPQPMRFSNSPSRARRMLKYGDTIVSTVRTYLKAVWFVDSKDEDLIGSTGFAVLTPNGSVDPEYLSYLLQSQNFVDRVAANSVGTSYPAISETKLASRKLALPGSLLEQESIRNFIRSETRSLTKAIDIAFDEINFLQEYRTRLIADVVTGKLDVRAAAEGLPAVTQQVLPDEAESAEEDGEMELADVSENNEGRTKYENRHK